MINIDPLGLAYSPQGERGIPREEAMRLSEGEDSCGCFAKALGWETLTAASPALVLQ